MKWLAVCVLGCVLGLALAQDTPDEVPHDQCGVSSVINEDDKLELFALGEDGGIYTKQQKYDGSWAKWTKIGSNFSSGVQAVLTEGRVEVFALGKDDVLYHNWETGMTFQENWVPLGGPFSGMPSALLNSEGNIVLFARGKVSRSLMYNHQVHNATATVWSGWSNLGGILTSGPSAVLTAEAMIHVFVRGVDKGMFEKKQVATHSGTVAWSKYDGLGGLLASHPSVPAALNPVNLLEIFVRQADRAIWFKKQMAITHEADSVMWTEWQSLGGKMSSGPSVVVNGDSLIEVFSRGLNREIFVKRQLEHDSNDYGVWESLGGDSASTPTTTVLCDSSVHVLYRGSDKAIYHKSKKLVSKGVYEWAAEWTALESDGPAFQLYSC